MKPIALQLYSVRAEAEKDFFDVLRKVADIGYKGVETAGLHGYDSKEISKLVCDLGMEVCSCHMALPTVDNINEIAEQSKLLGSKRVVCGFGRDDLNSVDACKTAAAKFSLAAELLKPYDITFSFHNHAWEFDIIDGRYVYDILMEEAPNVFSELDLYWTAYAKADPVEIILKYKSRLELIHIKDGPLEGNLMTAVGAGKMDIPSVIGVADSPSIKWMIVEIDACQGNMLEAVRDSYNYLVSNKLASGNR